MEQIARQKLIVSDIAIPLLVATFSFFIFTLPLFLIGEAGYVTIHDNLDQIVPYYKMFRDNSFFLNLDVPSVAFDGMSTLYYAHINYSVQSFLFAIFPTFDAYRILLALSWIVAYISTAYFLGKWTTDRTVLSIASATYASLPVIPIWSMAVATIPIFASIYRDTVLGEARNKISFSTWLLLFVPFLSALAPVGIFVISLWLISALLIAIRTQRMSLNATVGTILLGLGYTAVDFKIVYEKLFVRAELNRGIVPYVESSFQHSGMEFAKVFVKYSILGGGYHVPSGLFPVPVLYASAFLYVFWLNKSDRIDKFKDKNETAKMVTVAVLSLASIVALSAAGAIYDAQILSKAIVTMVPFLHEINWGRLWLFNRLFSATFLVASSTLFQAISKDLVESGSVTRKNIIGSDLHLLTHRIIKASLCIQLTINFTGTSYYYDSAENWKKVIATLGGVPSDSTASNSLSYREFFSENLFRRIKKEIRYENQNVVAFGFHPSVLMYNGFRTVDGYNNAYPKAYMVRFRRLIEPELEKNHFAKEYFDSWGGRLYLYSSQCSFEPDVARTTSIASLNVRREILERDFKVRYVISRCKISNASNLGLRAIGIYNEDDSPYTIYIYSF